MKILVIGDVFGKLGRFVLQQEIKKLKEEKNIDLVIANVENTTHGKGINYEHYLKLKNFGVDVMTSGNHIFNLAETRNFIGKTNDLLRPLNSNPYHPGKGTILLEAKGKKVRVTNLIGVVFMNTNAENPYFALEKITSEKDCDLHLVDFHSESTAEKIAFALFFDGKIDFLWGTHTHVQTADERILPKGTAFITDLGMTGPADGVIGAKAEAMIIRSRLAIPAKMEPIESGKKQMNAVLLTTDEIDNSVIKLERINYFLE